MNTSNNPKIALLPWGDLIEDFLDGIGVSLEEFCVEMSGGWLFGYVDALKSAGVQTVVYCVSDRVGSVARFVNEPTGATFCVLPAGRLYRRIRVKMRNPYGSTVEDAFGDVEHSKGFTYSVLRAAAPYLATPLISLIRELRRDGCSAILCQEYEYARFDVCVLTGGLLNLPVFATFQGGNSHFSSLESALRPLSIKASSGLIIGPRSEAERARARYSLPVEKIARVFNPLDVGEWKPAERGEARKTLDIPTSTTVVVWHGRVDLHRKGLDVLVDAWRAVLDRGPSDILLLLVGTGDDADELRERLDGVPKVRWSDQYTLDRDRLRTYLSAADLSVLPSRHEGFAVAPIEAMACGLPVVGTAVPGIPELLDAEPPCGIIIPPADAESLAGGMLSLIHNPQRTRTLGNNARRRVRDEVSIESIGRQLRGFLGV